MDALAAYETMCSPILLLPVLSLPLLWLLPPVQAIAAYTLVFVASAAPYFATINAMRKPALVGMQALLHAIGTVRIVEQRPALIWIHSELWSAEGRGRSRSAIRWK